MLSNLAIVAEQDDDYGTARQLHEQVLDLCRAAGDRWKLAVCHINLGNLSGLQGVLSDASRHYSEAARLCREVGDPWLLTQAQHGLANTDRDLTRLPEAGAVYLESLDGLRRFDDPVSVAALYEDIARFAVRAGQPETALRLAGVANRIRRHTGAPRFDVDQADLDSALAPARAMVADPDGAEAEGQALSDGDAAALVRRLVAVVTP
jgi:tetratricopeptide (TPR) repeat protein